MALPGNQTAIVKSPEKLDLSNMNFQIKSFDESGNSTVLEFAAPQTNDFNSWAVATQVGMLKRGPWKAVPVSDIYFGLAYAHKIGADVMQGDLFPTGEGRWGTSNKYKIKQALKTGKIKGWDVKMEELNIPVDLKECVQKKELKCTVTIEVDGLNKPITRSHLLSRWFKGNNPNWKGNPEHMLQLNTFAHACEYVTMMAGEGGMTEDDEAPPAQSIPTLAPQPSMLTPGKGLIESLRDEVSAEKVAKGEPSLEQQLKDSLMEAQKDKPIVPAKEPVTIDAGR